jgi:hypothetical protein
MFLTWFTTSVWVVNKIELGLDQKMAVPEVCEDKKIVKKCTLLGFLCPLSLQKHG